MYKLANKPQTSLKLVKNCFQLWSQTLKKMLPISFVLVFITTLPIMFIPQLNTQDAHQVLSHLSDRLELFFFFIVAALFSLAAVYHRLYSFCGNKPASYLDTLWFATKKLPHLLAAATLYSLTIAGGAILAIIPGFIFGFYLAMYYPLILQDEENPWVAYKHSWRLVTKNWFHTTGDLKHHSYSWISCGFNYWCYYRWYFNY